MSSDKPQLRIITVQRILQREYRPSVNPSNMALTYSGVLGRPPGLSDLEPGSSRPFLSRVTLMAFLQFGAGSEGFVDGKIRG